MSDFGWWGATAFVPFTAIDSITPATNSGSVATIITNTETWVTGDHLIAVSTGPQSASRTFSTPTPNWSSPTETWTEHYDDSANVGGNLAFLGVASARAQSSETSDLDVIWNSTLFNIMGGLLVCGGACIVRQVAPIAKVEGTGTSITTTFGAAPLVTSQLVSFAVQRTSSDTIVVPTSFTLRFNVTPNTNHRVQCATRIGQTSTTVQWTGLSSSSVAKIAGTIELARPGQEL